jgi:hypothetical protein
MGEVYEKMVNTRHELLARILDIAGCTKKREDQLKRTARHHDTAVAKCTEVDGGKFGKFIVDCNKYVISGQ